MSRGHTFLFSSLAFLLGLAVIVSLGELALRLRHHALFDTENLVEKNYRLAANACAVDYDPYLGWVPKAEKSGLPNRWNTQVSVSPEGFRVGRKSSVTSSQDQRPILAVGDSFVFGDQVDDEDSWPAILEASLSRRVLNAGVCGYGIDQILLRAESLVEKHDPEHVVFSFIRADLHRATWKAHPDAAQTPKPFLSLTKEGLTLQGVPVPRAHEPVDRMSFVHRVLGRSYLANRILGQLAPQYWYASVRKISPAIPTGDSAKEVGCAVFKRFSQLTIPGKRRTWVLVQDVYREESQEEDPLVDEVVDCVDQARTSVIDTRPIFSKLRREDPKAYSELFVNFAHLSPSGNALVSSLVQATLQSAKLP